jgi:hypothetical protein
MPTTLRAFMAYVTGMTIRAGQTPQQLELLINSRRDGLLSLRLIAIKGKPIRVTDMRGRRRPSDAPPTSARNQRTKRV